MPELHIEVARRHRKDRPGGDPATWTRRVLASTSHWTYEALCFDTRCRGKSREASADALTGLACHHVPVSTTTVRRVPAATRGAPPPPLSQRETIEDLLKQSARGAVPIRRTFLQQRDEANVIVPGPMASFVAAHDERGLDAYLFIHALASSEPWNCDYPSGMWVRALGLTETAKPASAKGAVSKIMRRLEERRLITRERTGRTSSVTLLREDGSGEPYEHPHTAKERWLQLPYAYWLEDHFQTLSLPAKAMLLIALSLNDGFYLPSERANEWYGISADSAERGLRELRRAGLLEAEQAWVRTHRSDTGWAPRWTYTLVGSFSKASRRQANSKRRTKDTTEEES